jgi:hypothetical protein
MVLEASAIIVCYNTKVKLHEGQQQTIDSIQRELIECNGWILWSVRTVQEKSRCFEGEKLKKMYKISL